MVAQLQPARFKLRFFYWYVGLVAFSILGSWLMAKTHQDSSPIASVVGPLVLCLGALSILDFIDLKLYKPVLIVILITILFGSLIEIIGAKFGFPFGHDQYTREWVPTAYLEPLELRIPIFVGVAWALIAVPWTVACSNFKPWWIAGLLAGIGCAFTDFLMEPMASGKLHYWVWQDTGSLPGGAPLENFIGWLGVSTLIGLAILFYLRRQEQRTALEKVNQRNWAVAIPIVHLMFLAALSYGIPAVGK